MTRIAIALVALSLATASSVSAQSTDAPPTRPGNLRATLYDKAGGELFWQRSTDDRGAVRGYEITRNGESLGIRDALSFYDRSLQPGVPYTFTVTAIDNAGQRSAVATTTLGGGTITPPSSGDGPAAPAALRSDVYSRRSAELFWEREPAALALRYEIRRDGEVVGTTNGVSYYTRDLAGGTDYAFEVIAIGRDGSRSPPSSVAVRTDGGGSSNPPGAGAPPAPAELRFEVYSTRSVELFWRREPVGLGLRYEIRRDGQVVGATDGISYFTDALAGGTDYAFDVITIAPDGSRSPLSSIAVRTDGDPSPNPPGAGTPPTPVELRADVYSRRSAELFWRREPVGLGLRYEIRRDGQVVGTTDGISYYTDALAGGTDYAFEVITIAPNGRRSPPSPIAVRTDGDGSSTPPTPSTPSTPPPTAGGPSAPAELTAEVGSERQVRLEWRRGPDELDLSYEIRLDGRVIDTRGPDIGFFFGFSINTLRPGTDYVFEVIAIDPDGRRSAPSRIEVRTDGETQPPGSGPPAPANLRVEVYQPTPGTPRQAALFWDRAATPGLRYEVQRNGFVFETTRRTSYYFEQFAGGNDFTFDIVAFDGERQSPPASVTVRFSPRTSLPERSDEPDAIDLASDRFAPEQGVFIRPSAFRTRALGDVDGDALADVLFTEEEGGAFVLPGRARGTTELDPRETSATGGYRVPPSASRALAGGDFNGDGVSDLIGAEPDETIGGSESAGRVWLLYGQRGGLADYASVDDIGPGEGAVFAGFAPDQDVGSVVSGVGDLDGDGFDDFAMLADPTFFPDRGGPGGVYVVYGSDALPESVPLGQIDRVGELISAPEPDVDSANSDFVYSAQIDGFVPVGDVNGDGLADLAIVYTAMPRRADSDPLDRSNQRTLLVLYGRAGGRLELPTVTDPISPERGYRLIDAPGFSTFFSLRDGILGAGDVDGDGTDDILVQGYGLVLGSTEPGPSSASTIDDLPESRLRPVSGLDDPFGPSRLYPIGDVNGDGRADLHTRDIRIREAEDEVGYVILDLFATADPLSVGNLRAQPGFPLVFADGARRRADAVGDVDGDGLDDFTLSGVFFESGDGRAIVYGSRDFR